MSQMSYGVINRMSLEELYSLAMKQIDEYQEIYDGGIIPLDIEERESRDKKLKTIETTNRHTINCIRIIEYLSVPH